MDVFKVDPAIASLINGMDHDELVAFTARHDQPTEDDDIEISIYAFLKTYVKFGLQKARENAVNLAVNWLNGTRDDDPDRQRRSKILETIGASVIEGSRDIGLEGGTRAERLFALYNQTGKQETLDLAIIDMMTSVAYTPVQHGDRAARLAFLGNLLGMRYRNDRERGEDLTMAIVYLETAINAAMDNDAIAYMWYVNLSTWLGERYRASRLATDLDEAIQAAEKGLERSPTNAQRIPCEVVLSDWLRERYRCQGLLADLNRLIEVGEEAVVYSRNDPGPAKGIWLANLAAFLAERFERGQSTSDISRAAEMAKEALEATPEGLEPRADVLSTLGYCLMLRSTRSGRLADMDEAVEFSEQAKALTTPQDQHLGQRLVRLGMCYIRRHIIGKAEGDVKLAIESIEEGLKHAVAGTLERPTWLDNLSLCYSCYAKISKSRQHLNKAVELAEEASSLPDSNFQRISAIFNLGLRLIERYDLYPNDDDTDKAIDLFKLGWDCSGGATDLRIASAEHAAKALASQNRWADAHDLLRQAVQEISNAGPRVMRPNDKQHILARSPGLASMAAAVALQAGASAIQALDLLELGRGVISRSVSDLRADLSQLEKAHGDLAKEYIQLRRTMEVPGIFKNTSFTNLTHNSSELFFKEARDAEAKFPELLTRIWACPGFENFLRPPTLADIEHAADQGPVIIINVCSYRCDAFIISDGSVRVLGLPNLTVCGLKECLGGQEAARAGSLFGVTNLYSTLEWLWDVAAGPILDDLGFAGSDESGELPHVWWIPTGLLSRLPIHAAGYHRNKSKDTVLDRVMSSYCTSVRALISGRKSTRNRPVSLEDGTEERRAVLVSMGQTPGASPLAYAEKETDVVEKLLQSMKFDTQRPPPRKYRVLRALESCTVFHFAGHGVSDAHNPSQSRLLLEDCESDPLTLDDIRDCWIQGSSFSLDWDDDFLTASDQQPRSVSNSAPFLAYLSACSSGTGRVDELSDENIHLASALQLAGFRHVIASLWNVSDRYCVDVARTVYETLSTECVTDAVICQGLHRAVKDLRYQVMGVQAGSRSEPSGRRVGQKEHAMAKSPTRVLPRPYETRNNGDKSNGANTMGSRDAIPVDGGHGGIEDQGGLVWTPFVHFGV